MSDPRLPEEIFDHVADHLHDTTPALRNCCLVSKSWIPRTRKHLFARVGFPTAEILQSWRETFPDPSTSPGCYTKTLSVGYSEAVTAADAEAGGWIRGFSRVERLTVESRARYPDPDELETSLVPFHGLSPVVKSLHVTVPVLPPSQAFSLILSFPLLEDLAVAIYYETSADNDGSGEDEMTTATQPSNPTIFTGTLELYLKEGMRPFARRLLTLPDGIHFRNLTLTCLREGDLSSTTALVEGCSHTLESLNITCNPLGASVQRPRPHP
jgi:hypothetical protein